MDAWNRLAEEGVVDHAAAAEVTSERQREYHDAIRAERDAYAAQAREASEGTQADGSMDVFNAMAEIRMGPAPSRVGGQGSSREAGLSKGPPARAAAMVG
ncbi:hypothetical protein AB0O34_19485 [Sphaerisporangium sp. NPDC088356]|uniref:hypothetical protein n=1 Tax=Sphaerisporangium sp. NPDC088356 TaxID=3154871 RepID=UPI0034166BD3